ncbi:MAG: ankyrin repeat domain-containing protein [Luteimonas sp.]
MRTPLIVPTIALLLGLSGVACRGDAMDVKHVFHDADIERLADAAADGDASRVRTLVDDGVDPDAHGDKGINLLQYAILVRSERGLIALLDAGADPNRPGLGGSTAVHSAAITNDPDVLRVVLAHRGDPNARHGETGATPLADATGPRTDAQFHMLLDAGADPNLADRTGNTPLHKAAMLNAGAQVLALLHKGADASARNAQSASFQRYYFKLPAAKLSTVARAQREAVIAWLRGHGVPLEAGAEV